MLLRTAAARLGSPMSKSNATEGSESLPRVVSRKITRFPLRDAEDAVHDAMR
jgi:hypothetical protein